jgi:hypothetical protein
LAGAAPSEAGVASFGTGNSPLGAGVSPPAGEFHALLAGGAVQVRIKSPRPACMTAR